MSETAPTRELDHRYNDGIDVWLLWRPADEAVLVRVIDAKGGEAFELEVGPDQRAYDVFHHPFAYAGSRGIGYRPLDPAGAV
jgi:hypothetical protein